MAWAFSGRSINIISHLHPHLQQVLNAALPDSPLDFGIDPNSLRTVEQQNAMVAMGKSQTMNSRHRFRVIDGWEECGKVVCAVDLLVYVDGKITWEVEPVKRVAQHILQTAYQHAVPMGWGGNWTTLKDYVHLELDWKAYPISKADPSVALRESLS